MTLIHKGGIYVIISNHSQYLETTEIFFAFLGIINIEVVLFSKTLDKHINDIYNEFRKKTLR